MKIMKFKTGDRVSSHGREGTVMKICPDFNYRLYVEWDNELNSHPLFYFESELKFAELPCIILDVNKMFEDIEL